MKKKLLLGLITLGAASMLCGFDSAQTAEGVLDKMNEVSSSVEGMTMDMDMNLDAAINISDSQTTSTLAIGMTGGFDVAAAMDPFGMSMDGSFKVSALTQAQEMTMKMYGVVGEDGSFDTYTYAQESADQPGQWVYQSEDDFDMNQIMELSKTTISASDYAEWGLNFTLAPEAADVNGTECYALSAVIDKDALNTMITKVSELAGQDLPSSDELSLAMSYIDGLQMNITYYVDTATYYPVSAHIDFNGSDLSTINSLLATSMGDLGEGTSAELVLNDFSMDMALDYSAVPEITVPQEALDAVASGAAVSADDMADALEEAAESEAGLE